MTKGMKEEDEVKGLLFCGKEMQTKANALSLPPSLSLSLARALLFSYWYALF